MGKEPVVIQFFMEVSEAELISKALSHVIDRGLEDDDLDLCQELMESIDEVLKDAD